MPSVAMSGLQGLLSLSMDVVEVGAQRISNQCREGQARLDGVVLDLFDQPERQVHVELLDLIVTHAVMLAS